MSTVDRPSSRTLPPLIDGERLDQPTFHDRYEAMPDGARAELIGGVVYMSPLHRGHGYYDGSIAGLLCLYTSLTPGLESVINVTTKLGNDAELQPDSQLYLLEEFGGQVRIEDDYIIGAPELAIEIGHSSRDYDLGAKKDQYERSGVLEYLFVGVDPNEVLWFARHEGRFQPMEAGDDGIYRSRVFPGLWLDPRALYAKDRRSLVAALERGLASPEHAAFVASLDARRAGR